MASSSPLLLFLASAISCLAGAAAAATFGFDIHHRFSTPVRQWAEAHGHPGVLWPEKEGTAEYYTALARHDRVLHRRLLAGSNSSELITFSTGNETGLFRSLAFLYYTFVELGTPSKAFLVALDTGSDLFWLPCDCLQCAPTKSPKYGNLEMNIYSPNKSSTSKTVPCTSKFCELSGQCSGTNSSCPYTAQYLYANTSSNGTLVEDTLHLIREGTTPEAVEASVIFGCGRFQTGAFLNGAAPDGLIGLGLKNISVPSILASKGIASNSFSMCFGSDGSGRINFGDKGSSDQQETRFSIDSQQPSYSINITEIIVGENKSTVAFKALVNSGISYTYVIDPIYTQLATSFAEQVSEKRSAPNPGIPFEYCYDLGPNQTEFNYPGVSLMTKGGSLFPINYPYILFSDGKENKVLGYCLAILKSNNLNIIGHNFLTGLRIVLDRERSILGWKQVNCYSGISTSPPASSPPASAPAPSSDIPDNKTKNAPAPSRSGVSSHLNAMTSIFLMLFLLAVAIL